jgi:hypothetical protein
MVVTMIVRGGEGAVWVGLVLRAFDDSPFRVAELDWACARGGGAGGRGRAGLGFADKVSLHHSGFGLECARDWGPEALDPKGLDLVGRRLHEVLAGISVDRWWRGGTAGGGGGGGGGGGTGGGSGGSGQGRRWQGVRLVFRGLSWLP